MFSKHKRWFHSSHVKFPLVNMSASWFLVSIYLIWMVSKLIRSNNLSRAKSVGSGNMSHCGASSLYNHLDHCFAVFKHIQQSFLMRKSDVWGKQSQHYPKHWSLLEIGGARDSYHGKQQVSPFYHGSELCFQGPKQSDPINREREYRLISIRHPKRWFLILLNCAKLKFVSYTSNWLEQMYEFQKCTMYVDFESLRIGVLK